MLSSAKHWRKANDNYSPNHSFFWPIQQQKRNICRRNWFIAMYKIWWMVLISPSSQSTKTIESTISLIFLRHHPHQSANIAIFIECLRFESRGGISLQRPFGYKRSFSELPHATCGSYYASRPCKGLGGAQHEQEKKSSWCCVFSFKAVSDHWSLDLSMDQGKQDVQQSQCNSRQSSIFQLGHSIRQS